jgi:hypothetical protein
VGIFRNLRQLYTDDRTLIQLQNNIKEMFQGLRLCPLIDGVLLDSTTLTTSPTTIPHNLGRQPQGWLVVDINNAATVHRTAWDTKFLTLQASAINTTVVIWVF